MSGVHCLITAALTSALASEAPDEIVYIPDGVHNIRPSVNGKPQDITVSIPAGKGKSIAAKLQAALDQRLAENVRPHLAFDHKTGPAAGIPKSFRYEPGRGIILSLDWTASGRSAIQGGDYGYFSPAFLVDGRGVPSGLPDKGEIGSLVNEPAFRDSPRIAAASEISAENLSLLIIPIMNTVLGALEIDPASEDAESAAMQRIHALQASAGKLAAAERELEELRSHIAAHEADDRKRRTQEGEDLHRRGVRCGLFRPADERKKASVIKAAEDGNETALELMHEQIEAAERSARRDLTQAIVQAGREMDDSDEESGISPMRRLAAAFAEDEVKSNQLS